MKRCPQCDFVYEDDQSFCDMDGNELFHAAQTLPLPPLERVAPETAGIMPEVASVSTEPATVATEATTPPPKSKRKSKRMSSAVTATAAVVLIAVLFMVYYAVTQRPRPVNLNGSVARVPTTQQPTPQLVPSPALAEVPLPELSSSPDLTPSSPAEKPSTPVRLPSSPVSAGDGTGYGPVVIRLNNGAAIKADEAWEKKEGIWYRQGSIVTLLKRSRVKAIERPAPVRSAAVKREAKKPNAGPDAKKESRISSLLKTTGRILKKPFKL
ncbi:MAG TPA: hypothetical protein VGJ55_05965 [Pyrinomonadaceae bacterium]|jgi:hypothetical protein